MQLGESVNILTATMTAYRAMLHINNSDTSCDHKEGI